MLYANRVDNWEAAIDRIICGDCNDIINLLPDKVIDVCITSPPYWQQRDYGYSEQIGLEKDLSDYLTKLVNLFDGVKRVLKDDGTLWVNLGDCFNENTGGYFNNKKNDAPSIGKYRIKTEKYQKQHPRRSLLFIPQRFAIRMIDDKGWTCRNHIIWRKKVVQPTTARNRFTIDFEPIFMFSKNRDYYFDKDRSGFIQSDDIFIQPRERRSVWDLSTEHTGEVNHSAPFPEDIVEIPIDASCRDGAIVLDMFMGSGTTAVVAKKKGFRFFGGDASEDFCKIAEDRISNAKH